MEIEVAKLQTVECAETGLVAVDMLLNDPLSGVNVFLIEEHHDSDHSVNITVLLCKRSLICSLLNIVCGTCYLRKRYSKNKGI